MEEVVASVEDLEGDEGEGEWERSQSAVELEGRVALVWALEGAEGADDSARLWATWNDSSNPVI